MIFVGLVLVGFLIYSVKDGQYDDLDGEGQRILFDDEDGNIKENASPPDQGKK
jgi:cbb3-type cytochrome oxidase maturation protein